MDKVEALVFIGLKEPITEKAIQERYTERFNYFQMLYTNASNRGYEKIQQQNLEKLNHAKKILLEEIAAKKNNFIKTPAKRITFFISLSTWYLSERLPVKNFKATVRSSNVSFALYTFENPPFPRRSVFGLN